MPWYGETYEEVLLPSAARTAAAGTAVSNEPMGNIDRVRAQLNVTAVGGTSPSLSGFIESTVDGVNWDAQGTFAAKTGVAREVITINPWIGRQLRFRWTLTGTSPSATFDVTFQAEGDK